VQLFRKIRTTRWIGSTPHHLGCSLLSVSSILWFFGRLLIASIASAASLVIRSFPVSRLAMVSRAVSNMRATSACVPIVFRNLAYSSCFILLVPIFSVNTPPAVGCCKLLPSRGNSKVAIHFSFAYACHQVSFSSAACVCNKVGSCFIDRSKASKVDSLANHFNAAPVFGEPMLGPLDCCFRIQLVGSAVKKEKFLISVVDDLFVHCDNILQGIIGKSTG